MIKSIQLDEELLHISIPTVAVCTPYLCASGHMAFEEPSLFLVYYYHVLFWWLNLSMGSGAFAV